MNGNIVFPQSLNFVAIPESAFEGCSRLTGLSNNTGTTVGLQYLPGSPSYNPRGSNNIPDGLNIPSNVQTIGPNAFKGCADFTGALNLLPQLVSVGESAFQECTGFTSVNLPVNPLVTAISTNCFKGCTGITNLAIPENIQYIMDGAFQGCVNIDVNVDVSNIRGIYNNAFNGCGKLSGILVLGRKLTTLGDRAFYGCPLLTSVTFLGVPPSNLKNAVAIFGLDSPNTLPFYVNVFQDNGWVPINAQGESPLSIDSVFRTHDSTLNSTQSRVVMSFIDFTFIPIAFATVRELSMVKCDPAAFLMWDNSGQGGANTQLDPAIKEWHDVYMPGWLKGVDLVSAQDAVSAALTAERDVKLQTIVNQYASNLNETGYIALHATMTAGSAIHGNNLRINAGPHKTGIDLVSLSSPTGITAADNTYSVYSTGTGDAQVDTLSFGATVGSPSVVVRSVGAYAQYYISGSITNPALDAKYAKKVIEVDTMGVITIPPITVIETVVTSASNPAATTTGYTIQTISNRLFLNDLLAPMGAYYVASVGGGAGMYLNKLLYVDDESFITLPENEVTTVVPVASSTVSNVAGSNVAGVYSVSAVAGAGTEGYVLNVGNGTAAVPVTAGTYYIKMSNVTQFNNVIVHVSNGGGMSLNVTGLTGVAYTLNNLATAFCSDSIPIYPTDRDSDLLTNFMNSEYALVTSASQQAVDSLNTANANVNETVTNISRAATNPTNALLLSDTMKSAVADAFANHAMQDTEVTDMCQYYDSTYRAAKNNLDSGFKSLLTVQKSAVDAVDFFIQNSIYDNVANPTSNNLDYITTELNNYMTAYAIYQQANDQLWDITHYTVNLNMNYTALSRVKKNLADEAARLISNWLATTENGNTWTVLMNYPVYSISTFISTVIVPANTVNGVNPYQAFLNSHPVPNREQVKAAIVAYESTMALNGINPRNAAATAAGAAYQAAYPNATVHDKDAVGTTSATVYGYYYSSQYAGNFKAYFNDLVNTFKNRVSAVSSKLTAVEQAAKTASASVNSLYNTLNTEVVVANTNALNAANVSNKHVNGAQVRYRMLDLYNVILSNKVGSQTPLPTFDNSPEYEKSWFTQRFDNYCNASIGLAPLTIARAMTAYNAANNAFKAKKQDYVYAMTNSYFANNPPISTVVASSGGIPQALVRKNVFKCLSNVTSFMSGDLTSFVSTVANQFTEYVQRRDAAIAGITNSEAKTAALLAYKQSEIVNADAGLRTAAIEYGMAMYNMYMAVIDFAIADLMANTSSVDANAFQTNMHNYKLPVTGHSPSEYLPALKSTIFAQVYFTNVVEPTIPYALMATTATGALSLYDIFNRGLAIVNDSANLSIVPIETYSSTPGNIPDAFIIIELQYATNLRMTNISEFMRAGADTTVASEYNITVLESTATLAVNTQLSIRAGLYSITVDGWGYYGYEQSSQLNNSLVKLAPNETAVFLYRGTGNLGMVPPAGLVAPNSQTEYNTFFCDDAEYIVFVQPDPAVADGGKIFNMYTWDSYGRLSGKLIFSGTISKMGVTVTNTVSGCFQPQAGSVKLIGDLVVSNAIKTVGVNAFANCNALASLTFARGSSSVDVKDSAFANCSGLTAINLGSTVSSAGRSAFLNCAGAGSLKLSANPAFTVVNHFAFLGCSNASNNLVLPPNVTQVNIQSFAQCSSLTCQQLNGETTYLPEKFNKIGFGAFEGCSGLSGALNFNNIFVNRTNLSSIQFIGSSAFFGCSGLNEGVTLPINTSYRNILPYTFASSAAPFARKQIPMDQPGLPMQLKGMLDFSNVYVERIYESAFYKCTALTGITLSTIIYEFGNNAFKLCNGLVGMLALPALVKILGDSAFEGCSKLTGLDIVSTTVSETATTARLSIGASAFKDCELLTNSSSSNGIVIPNTVTQMGDFAFSGCANMPAVSIGSGLITPGAFGKGMFVNCTKLAKVTIAFSFLAKTGGGGSVVSGADDNTNLSFTGCSALGVLPRVVNPSGSIIIQPGTTDWVSQRAPFFNRLTIVVTNKNIIFYMNEFNSELITLTPVQESVITQSVPLTDAQATIYLKASDLRKVFSVSTDSYLNPGGLDLGEMYYVSPEYIPFFNVAHAHVVQGGIEAYNAAPYEQLIKDDVLRHQSSMIFGSADWTTIFMNGNEIKENLVASSSLIPSVPDGEIGANAVNTGIFYNIIQLLKNIAYTTTNETNPLMTQSTYPPNTVNKWWGLTNEVTPEQGNICKKLFNLIRIMDPERIHSMVRTGATPMNLPLLSGDQFIFVLKVNKKDVKLTMNSNPISIDERTYLIKLILTEDFDSGSNQFIDHNVALYSKSLLNKNIIPVDSGYSAEYAYANYDVHVVTPDEQSSSITATTTSYYSRVTQNYAYEPVRPPQNIIGVPGWYFPSSAQSTQLDFTPAATDLKYYDLQYLSANLYFPNSWSSDTQLPNVNNFPTWNVTFTNGVNTIVLTYGARFLTGNGDVLDFLGQKNKFNYTNPNIQLLAPFEASVASMPNGEYAEFASLLSGNDINNNSGSINSIPETNILGQQSNRNVVNGLHQWTENPSIGPFTYPSIRRNFQCIHMPTNAAVNGPAVPAELIATGSRYNISKITLDINIQRSTAFVPNIIVKSVEVVTKKYETFYLAPYEI